MRGDRAQSESIGVVILTGVVVILIGGSSAAVFALGAGGGGVPQLADLQVDATASTVTIEHLGGDAIRMADSAVLVRSPSTDDRYTIDVANVTGDSDDRFEPGERFERAHGVGGDRATFLIVDTDTNEVLARASVDLVI